ncbi:MAG: hypothetical protein IPL78_24780 [Chloroflexi bacterium]|nr:hypothetical protein [Chloroflexota bacterium]
MLDSESRQDLPFADEDMIADCRFTAKNVPGGRMMIKLINVQGTPKLFLVYPVEPSSMFVWSIEKSVTTQ